MHSNLVHIISVTACHSRTNVKVVIEFIALWLKSAIVTMILKLGSNAAPSNCNILWTDRNER